MSRYQVVKQQVVETAQRLTERGYLMATGGNLSIRLVGHAAFAVTAALCARTRASVTGPACRGRLTRCRICSA